MRRRVRKEFMYIAALVLGFVLTGPWIGVLVGNYWTWVFKLFDRGHV